MKTRTIIPGVPHHVIVRGNNRRRLFSYPRDYRTYFELLARGMAQTGCKMHALCLMSNHGHMLITPPDEAALSTMMHKVNQSYSLLRNASRNATGKLFEQSYWSKPKTNDSALSVCQCYIEANPERGAASDDIELYRWSSYRLSSGSTKKSEWWRDLWTPTEWYEGLGDSPEERAERYRECYRDYLDRGVRPDDFELIEKFEALSTTPYRRRLRRPDGTRAAEPTPTYGHFRSEDE